MSHQLPVLVVVVLVVAFVDQENVECLLDVFIIGLAPAVVV